MAAKPVKVAFLADTADLRSNLQRAEDAMDSAAAEARTAGQKIDTAFDSTAESADTVASKGAQAAGALSGLGDLVGGKFGAAMATGGVAMQAFADAGDLLNVVTDSAIVRKAKDIAMTTAHKAATLASAAAQKTPAAATRVLNLAMAASPVGLVVLAVVALVAALVLAYRKSDTFRRIVDKAFSVVKGAAQAVARFFTTNVPRAFDKVQSVASSVLGWVKGNWPKILGVLTGPFALAASAIGRSWGRVKDGASAAKRWVVDRFNDLVGFVRGLPDRITSATSRMWNGITSAFRGAINAVIGMWNGLSFSIPGFDWPGPGSFGGITISTPNIPYLARGGVVFGPTLALIGEDGPEAVVPLGSRGFGNTYHITVNAPVGSSPVEIGRTLAKHIDAYERAGGRRRA